MSMSLIEGFQLLFYRENSQRQADKTGQCAHGVDPFHCVTSFLQLAIANYSITNPFGFVKGKPLYI